MRCSLSLLVPLMILAAAGVVNIGLDFLLVQSSHARVQPTTLASLYACLGETEQALGWLERAVEQHEGEVVWLKARSDYDSLRRDPRFTNLLKRTNLDQ